ncbi:hypothetical protein [Streptomyces olivaceoviridis]
MTDGSGYSVEERAAAALTLLRTWASDIETAQEHPGAEWTLDADARLLGVADCDEDAEIWAHYLGIDLTRTGTGTLSGQLDYTPDGPFGPVIPVVLTSK